MKKFFATIIVLFFATQVVFGFNGFEAPRYWEILDNTTIRTSEYSSGNQYAVSAPGITAMTVADADYYIASDGVDNDDCSISTPCLTVERAMNNLPDIINHNITINAAAGTYWETEDDLKGKIILEGGSLTIQGEVTVVADAGGNPYTATGGVANDGSGYGTFVVSGAGWTPNDYQNDWIRMEVDYLWKYIPIISNTNDTLTVPQLSIPPIGGTTEFSIVSFDSIFTGSASGTPTVGSGTVFTLDNNRATSEFYPDDEGHYRGAFTFDGISIRNSNVSGMIAIYQTNAVFRGLDAYADSRVLQAIYAQDVGAVVNVMGMQTTGNVGSFVRAVNRASAGISEVYADYSAYTGTTHYSIASQRGSYINMSLFAVEGDSGHSVTSAGYASDSGSIFLLNYGKIDYADSALDVNNGALGYVNAADRLYGNNVDTLYKRTNHGTIKDYDQTNLTYTNRYDFDADVLNNTALPSTCNVGQLFQDTDSDDCADTGGGDGALCICKTANTWALISNF